MRILEDEILEIAPPYIFGPTVDWQNFEVQTPLPSLVNPGQHEYSIEVRILSGTIAKIKSVAMAIMEWNL
jgi:hypothetical protein